LFVKIKLGWKGFLWKSRLKFGIISNERKMGYNIDFVLFAAK
jgi:hypothetical protein